MASDDNKNTLNYTFHYPIDVDAVLAHLRQDMRDDWFFDNISYHDLFLNLENLTEKIEEKISAGHGIYSTSLRAIYDVPKGNLGLRYSLETDFYDRFIYQSICSFLLPYYDPILSKRVLSHRYNPERLKEKYLFKNRIELWTTFEGITKLGLSDGKALLATDLINYFEHISISNIDNSFSKLLPEIKASPKEKGQIRSAIYTLCLLLKKWCFNEHHGLPQNRDASSFIANVVLTEIDREMQRKGYDYFRYVDDIRIICNDKYHAKKALNELIFELRKIGMNINSKKTTILDSSSSSDEVDGLFPGNDDKSLVIDNMWKSKSKNVIIRSVPVLIEMLRELIDKGETQSRRFRFCINRIKLLVSTKLFDSSSILSDSIVGTLLDSFYTQPASTDQFCKLLADLNFKDENIKKIEDFLTNENFCIYSWQNYHIWILLMQKDITSEKLINRAKHVCGLESLTAEASACFLFLAHNNEIDYLESLSNKINDSWSFQMQRYYLISLQKSNIKSSQDLIKNISPEVKGTISGVTKNKSLRGLYSFSLNNMAFTEIYNELNPYD